MATEPSPHYKRAVELMADGRWHRRDDLVLEMGKLIPTGMALRDTEDRRVRRRAYRQSLGKPVNDNSQDRLVQRSVEFRAAAGRRRLCVAVLANHRRFAKLIDQDGVIWHRDPRVPLPGISSSHPLPSASAEPAEVDET